MTGPAALRAVCLVGDWLCVICRRTGHVIEPSSLDILFAESGPEVAWLDDMRATLGMALRRLGKSANTRDPGHCSGQRAAFAGAAARHRAIDDPADLDKRGKLSVSMGWSNDVFSLVRKVPQVRFLLPKKERCCVDFACVLQSARQPDVGFAFWTTCWNRRFPRTSPTRGFADGERGAGGRCSTPKRAGCGDAGIAAQSLGKLRTTARCRRSDAALRTGVAGGEKRHRKGKSASAALPPPVPEKAQAGADQRQKWVNPFRAVNALSAAEPAFFHRS